MNKYKNQFPLIAGVLYLLTITTAVLVSSLSGFYRFNLRHSFSIYVGMHYSTSILYFVAALIMLPLLTIYIIKTKLPLIKKIVYAVVFACIFGTAFFPCNTYSNHPNMITIRLHNDIAIGLMLAVTVSFILSVILSKRTAQRMIGIGSLVYAAIFVVLFYIRFQPLFQTFFIWENLFIVLLLLELQMEQYGEALMRIQNK